MAQDHNAKLRMFEGLRVSVALTDGSRIDDCQLVSAGRHATRSLWLFVNGTDCFVPVAAVVDIWEVPAVRRAA